MGTHDVWINKVGGAVAAWLNHPYAWALMFLVLAGTYIGQQLLTTNKLWHDRFHVRRNVNLAMKCSHCERAWTNRCW
jgi:hypothetical protein